MDCDRCGTVLEPEEAMAHGSQHVCEDCLMDAMSPAQGCDPWAVKLATGATTSGGGEGELKGLEKAIFERVKKEGRVPREAVPALFGVRPPEAKRALAVLRHMELLRSDRREDGGADLVLFGTGRG